MIRVFLDQALPLRAETRLVERGVDALHATTAGLGEATDEAIAAWCVERGYVIVTHDHGFHRQIALSNASAPSVIRIRLQGLTFDDVAALIARVITAHEQVLRSGAMISVTRNQMRVRRLPLRDNP